MERCNQDHPSPNIHRKNEIFERCHLPTLPMRRFRLMFDCSAFQSRERNRRSYRSGPKSGRRFGRARHLHRGIIGDSPLVQSHSDEGIMISDESDTADENARQASNLGFFPHKLGFLRPDYFVLITVFSTLRSACSCDAYSAVQIHRCICVLNYVG